MFVHCCALQYSLGGIGYAPSVWTAQPHDSAEAARRAGIEELLERFDGPNPRGGPVAVVAERAALRSQLENHIRRPSLF